MTSEIDAHQDALQHLIPCRDGASDAHWDNHRLRQLSRFLPLWPNELNDLSIAGRRRTVALMSRALRAERQRGRSGHWTYDLARHAALFKAYRLEHAALRRLELLQHQTQATRSDP